MRSLLVVCSLLLASCAHWTGGTQLAKDLAVCALDKVPGCVADVAPNVAAALQGTDQDWASMEKSLMAEGIDFALCAIKVALNDIHMKQSKGMFPRGVHDKATARAKAFAAAHGRSL